MKKNLHLLRALSLVAILSFGALAQINAANPGSVKNTSKSAAVAPTPNKESVWSTCKQKPACKKPGRCDRYTDSNSNQKCDRGETAPTPKSSGGCANCSACPTPCYKAKK